MNKRQARQMLTLARNTAKIPEKKYNQSICPKNEDGCGCAIAHWKHRVYGGWGLNLNMAQDRFRLSGDEISFAFDTRESISEAAEELGFTIPENYKFTAKNAAARMRKVIRRHYKIKEIQ